MEQSREDRWRSRMRGAARHQVQDADFGDLFAAIPVPDPEPDSESSDGPTAAEPDPTPPPLPPTTTTRTNPNTSAKRRRLESVEGNPATQPSLPVQQQVQSSPAAASSSSANRSSRRRPAQPPPTTSDPYDLDNVQSTADEAEVQAEKLPSPDRAPAPTTQEARAKRIATRTSPRNHTQQTQSLSLSALPVETEEVGESPADAPGSGHRRRVRADGAIDSSALLQSALRSVDNATTHTFPQSSSPLSRKSRRSAAGSTLSAGIRRTTGLRRSTRLSGSPDDEVNELSLDLLENANTEAPEETALEIAETVVEEPPVEAEEEIEEAEEVDVRELARQLARKRPRRSAAAAAASPELASDGVDEEPVLKRPRRGRPPGKKSPAKQRQPKAPRAKSNKTAKPQKRGINQGKEDPIPIKVQRFTKDPVRAEDNEDIRNSGIPFGNPPHPNSVDVLAHVCKEIIEGRKNKVKENGLNAPAGVARKEARTQFQALEAFLEELRTRFLEHTIALNHVYSLKKRVREAQRAKVKLRERIMQIRAEREQVALRMDAVRIKHDVDSKDALYNINLSAAMHNIDLAIEEGRAAPELSAKEQQTADLANLEVLISRVAEQACGSGPGGGALKQIKSFNAFLERAVAAL